MNGKSMRKAAGTKLAAALSAITIGMATIAGAAPTPEQKCEGGKNNAAGKYAACVAKAESGYVITVDATKYATALAKCESKMISGWDKLEQKAVAAMTTCPTTGDQSAIGGFLDACAQSVAVAVGGGTLPLDVVNCNADLTACDTDLATCDTDLTTCAGDLAACQSSPTALPLRSGQTGCWNAAGTSISCAGSGQDGEFQNGATRSFTNNGDGTITDNATGLMWEVLSDDGSIHDKDNTYTWSNAYTVKVDGLNGASFAGHADWRLPNRLELETLRHLGASSPATYAEFDTGCVAACTVGDCSCTDIGSYWSSTTVVNNPDFAWNLDATDGGGADAGSSKAGALRVRAVRGATDAEVCTVAELASCEADIVTVNADAAACEVELAACATNCDVAVTSVLATGETTAYGPGSDGSLEKGRARSFTDNGDGTITDNTTGLMWEKKSDDGSIHDRDNTYSWGMTSPPYTMNGTMVTTFLATLNGGGGFAGHTDWRIPNVHELESLRNFGANNPAVYPAFNDSCTGGCTVTTCSCTRSDDHWSSTTVEADPSYAWSVYFYSGYTNSYNKTFGYYVRAVRAGS